MKTVYISLMLCLGGVAQAADAKDHQDRVAAEVIQEGMILVRNDARSPYEIKRQDIGKYLLCLSIDTKKAGVIPITKTMFPSREPTVLVHCRDGVFEFGRGYI